MRFIAEEPKDEIYVKLIQYAIQTCDVFMFVICNYYNLPDYNTKMNRFLERLNPLLLKTRHNGLKSTSWPGSESWDLRHERNIMFFKNDQSAIDTLLRPKSLFNWLYHDYPEDLCFFRNGQSWLTSSAHERMAYIIADAENEISTIESMGVIFGSKEYKNESFAFYEEYKDTHKE